MVDFDISAMDDNAIYKEVWNTDNIGAKTELNNAQVRATTEILTLASLFSCKFLQDHVKMYMIHQKSLNRQSNKEHVEVLKAKITDLFRNNEKQMGGLLG